MIKLVCLNHKKESGSKDLGNGHRFGGCKIGVERWGGEVVSEVLHGRHPYSLVCSVMVESETLHRIYVVPPFARD